jgi:hypothetical protein
MSNLTLAIDDQLLKRARDYAHKRGTTVNALVRKLLEREVRPPGSNLRAVLLEISRHAKPDPDYRFSREEIYAERCDRHAKRNPQSPAGQE